MPPRARAPKPDAASGATAPAVDVTAVLVAHDGAQWLPEALAALSGSAVRPTTVLAVDTGSTDGSAELLREVFGTVLELPRDTGFGAAVAAALAAGPAPATGWLWLLHDDCAPEQGALGALLEHAAESPSAVLLGPKARDWSDPRVLVEVGITTDSAGHRETGLEHREYDQGQHDDVRDVLAVGTAGALIRRDVWDALGGLDPSLAVFRDDLDLGWRVNAAGHRVVVVPRAVVRHARAATTGRRAPDAAPGRPTGTDRRHALYVLAAHATGPRLLALLPRLAVATVLRALGYLLTRQVPAAADELRAFGGLLGHPARLRTARRSRAATRTVPRQALRRLFASRAVRVRARAGAVGDWLSGGATPGSTPLGALGDAGPEGPDALLDLDDGEAGVLGRLLRRPGVLLTLALVALCLVAEWALLPVRGGTLSGGRLLPAPDGARDLWDAYAATWHRVSVGSPAAAPPAVAVLAALSTLALGKVWLATDLLLLGCVPLAGVVAYRVAGRVVANVAIRLWAAATWALLPVATGAVAAGRLDVAAVQVALPALAASTAALLGADPARAGWRRAWGLGLALSVVVALAPQLWPPAVAVVAGGGLLGLVRPGRVGRAGGRRRAAAALIAVAVPFVLLLPWSLTLSDPAVLALGPGRSADVGALVDRGRSAWQLLLLSPGGAGGPATWLTAGVLLAALGGLAHAARRSLAAAGWAAAGAALVLAFLLARLAVTPPGGGRPLPVWPGVPLQVAAAGLLLAALVGADGARVRLARSSFGWRQVVAGLVAVVAAAFPVLAAASWVARGAGGPLTANEPALLPAFVRAETATSPGIRVLVLRRAPSGALRYALVGGDGTRWGSADTPPRPEQTARLDAIVADLATPSGSDAAEALSTRAVRYVALVKGRDTADLALVLDAQGGLSRRGDGRVLLWEVVAPTSRLSLLPPDAAAAALSGVRAPSADLLRTARPEPVAAGREGARAAVPTGPPGRLLVLAEAADRGWSATLDGRELARRTAWGWAQAFSVPAHGGRLVLRRRQEGRTAALAGEGAAVLVTAVLAAPAARRRRGLEVAEDDEPDQEAT